MSAEQDIVCQGRKFVVVNGEGEFYRSRCFRPPATALGDPRDFICSPFTITSDTNWAQNENATRCHFTACPGDRVRASMCTGDGGSYGSDTYLRLYDTDNVTNLVASDDICGLGSLVEYSFNISVCKRFSLAQGCYDDAKNCFGQTAVKYYSYTPLSPVICEIDIYERSQCVFPDPGPGYMVTISTCSEDGGYCSYGDQDQEFSLSALYYTRDAEFIVDFANINFFSVNGACSNSCPKIAFYTASALEPYEYYIVQLNYLDRELTALNQLKVKVVVTFELQVGSPEER